MNRATRSSRLGAIALMLRPAYVATEVVTAQATTGGYSFVHDSVSRLAEIGCSPAYCSPRHAVMNGSFLGFGALLAGGAVLSSRGLGPWATGLLVVSGLSSMATGLAPLDQDAALHALAATPLFVAQPISLAVLGSRMREDHPRLAAALWSTATVTGTAAVLFVLNGGGQASGLLERLALWPVLGALAAVGWTELTRPTVDGS